MLPAITREASRRFGDRPALQTEAGWTVSFAELDVLSDRVALGLAGRGINEGDVVALVLPSQPDYVVAYLAAAKLGAVTTGVNPRLLAPERARVIDRAAPRQVLATVDLAAGLPLERTIVVEPAGNAAAILASLQRGGDAPPSPEPDPDRPVTIVWTSGTTGEPKGAVFAERQLEAIVERDVGGVWGGAGPTLAATQFAHVGFMTKLPWYLMGGGTTHLLDRWTAAGALRLVALHRMTTVGGVAPQVALMLRHRDFDTYDFSAVRAIIMGGGPSSPALVEEARRRFGAAYSIRYSSTESGGVGTATAFDADDDEALHTVGRPRPGVDLAILDETGRRVTAGDVGEIVLRSPTLMTGYWRDPEATAAALIDGWLHTGDLGHLDDHGRLHLAGRRREMFVRGGYNVHPLEVEAVLGRHPGVADVVVVPRPDGVMGEIGVAVVVARSTDEPPTLDDLRTFAAGELAHHKLPEAMRLVDELPLTSMNKVDRMALADDEAASVTDGAPT